MPSVEYRGMNLVIPENDSEWREHFKLARGSHKLMLRACKACDLMRYPPSHGCPFCGALEWSWREVSGRGHIYSYEIVAHAIQPGFKEWTPYAVVLVELDEQRGKPTEHEALRIIANLVTPELRPEPEANVAIGKRVRVIFQDLSEDFALPQFTLTDEPPEGRVWSFPARATIRAHLLRGARDRTLNVQRVRLACGHRRASQLDPSHRLACVLPTGS